MIRHFFMTALKKDAPPELEDTILGEYQRLKDYVPGITNFHTTVLC